jgi:hypothetical protein
VKCDLGRDIIRFAEEAVDVPLPPQWELLSNELEQVKTPHTSHLTPHTSHLMQTYYYNKRTAKSQVEHPLEGEIAV